jgi:hypothetical protein
VEADPGRRRLGGRRSPGRARARPRRPAARDLGRCRRRAHLQLPAVHGASAVRESGEDRHPVDRGVQ